MPRYRVLPHTADIGIASRGATVEAAFENAAFGMFDLMFDLSAAGRDEECRVEVEGETTVDLLVAWLSELLAEAEIRGLAFGAFRVEMAGGGRLQGTASGTTAAALELRGPPVKAVTYHGAAVEAVPGGWEARVIFDV